MKIYTRKGDDGSTGLFYGGRVAKDDSGPEAYGAVDEAVSALGAVRAIASEPLAEAVLAVQRDLFVAAAELATGADNRSKLVDGESRVSETMVTALEVRIDQIEDRSGMPTEFVVPGGSVVAAAPAAATTASAKPRWACGKPMQPRSRSPRFRVTKLARLARTASG